MDPRRRLGLVYPLVLALLITACGAAEQSAGGQEPEASGGGGGESAAPSAPGEQATSFRVVSLSFDLAELPYLAALDAMREAGYEIEYVQMTAAAEIGVEGVASGLFQFGAGAFPGWAGGIQAGAPLQVILQRRLNDWQVYGVTDIESCEDLGGRTVAIHSESSISAAMIRNWIAETCPETEPNYVVIAGSENRYAALLAGQIDASPIELVDALRLEEEAGDEFHRITSFAESLPNLAATVQAVNSEWAEQNPDVVQELVEAVLLEHRKVAEDPGYLMELAERYPDMVTEPPTQEAVDRYSQMFPVNGGLTEEILEYTIDFFIEGGQLDPGLTVDELANLTYLEQAIDKIGEQ